MMHPWSTAAIAIETARERQRAGERLARLLPGRLPRSRSPRRRLAELAASVSRATAALAIRLDERILVAGNRRSRET